MHVCHSDPHFCAFPARGRDQGVVYSHVVGRHVTLDVYTCLTVVCTVYAVPLWMVLCSLLLLFCVIVFVMACW